jgi:hypothetical protein
MLLRRVGGRFGATKLALDALDYEVLLVTVIRGQRLPLEEAELNLPDSDSSPNMLHKFENEAIRL